jgi:hypothetical protein
LASRHRQFRDDMQGWGASMERSLRRYNVALLQAPAPASAKIHCALSAIERGMRHHQERKP